MTPNLTGVAAVVNIANGLFAIVIVTALLRSEYGAVVAIVAGGIYYALTNTLAIMTLSGALTTIATARMEQGTVRRYHVLQAQTQRLPELPAPRLPVDPVQAPDVPELPMTRSWVPAEPVDESTLAAARAWVAQLFTSSGELDPAKVLQGEREPPGRVRIKGPPTKEAQTLLIRRGILRHHDRSLWFNMRYASPTAVREALHE